MFLKCVTVEQVSALPTLRQVLEHNDNKKVLTSTWAFLNYTLNVNVVKEFLDRQYAHIFHIESFEWLLHYRTFSQDLSDIALLDREIHRETFILIYF